MFKWVYSKLYNRFLKDVNSHPYSTTETLKQSYVSVDTAELALKEVQDQSDRIEAITAISRNERERNHFAEIIRNSMRMAPLQ